MMAERSTNVIGYKPYPPVNAAHVEWVNKNLLALQTLAEKQDPKSPAQREAIAILLAKFFMLYPPVADNRLSSDQFKIAVQRQKLAAEALVEDIAAFPAWAVEEGLKAYRRDEKGKWMPKTSGEVLPFIQGEYNRSTRALKDCRRILESDRRGLNVDSMRIVLDGIKDERLRADQALEMKSALEKSCDVFVDKVARQFYDYCSDIFQAYRIKRAEEMRAKQAEEDAE